LKRGQRRERGRQPAGGENEGRTEERHTAFSGVGVGVT
jgi:hypothetical protein